VDNKECLENGCLENADFIHMDSPENEGICIAAVLEKVYALDTYFDYSQRNIETLTDFYERPRHPILWLNHAIYAFVYLSVFRFPVVVTLFILSSITAFFQSLRKPKVKHNLWVLISWISLIHWVSIITLVFTHNRIQPRYIVVSEFVMCLTIALVTFAIRNKKDLIPKALDTLTKC
jgi:hypothetical protein